MILDKNNLPVKPGQIGELVHRGSLVSQGYWNDAEGTSIRFKRNPFQPSEIKVPEIVVYSGDYVSMDENGYLYFHGRKDDMIKCAGNRISPTEVEEIFYTFGIVKDVVVFGISHDIYGQSIFAVVSLRSEEDIDVTEILKRCREKMPSFMVPSRIEIWDEIPRNSNGKLDRAAVKTSVFRELDLKEGT